MRRCFGMARGQEGILVAKEDLVRRRDQELGRDDDLGRAHILQAVRDVMRVRSILALRAPSHRLCHSNGVRKLHYESASCLRGGRLRSLGDYCTTEGETVRRFPRDHQELSR